MILEKLGPILVQRVESILSQVENFEKLANDGGLKLNIDMQFANQQQLTANVKPKQTTTAARNRNIKNLYSTPNANFAAVKNLRPAAQTVMKILSAHASNGIVAKEVVYRVGRKHQLSNQKIGQALRRIELIKLIRRDSELIYLNNKNSNMF